MPMPSRALPRRTNAHTKHFRTTRAALYKATAALIACAALLAPSLVARRAGASTTADVRGASAETARDTKTTGVSPCGAPTFAVARDVPVAGEPSTFASADFNGDGLPDVALLNNTPRSVVVRFGNSAGGFGAPASYNLTGSFANRFVTAADVNKDGRPDLIVGSTTGGSLPGTVIVMLNDGAGNFGVPQSFATGADPHFAAVGDFNGDGNPDIATANNGSNDVSLLLGDGTGKFNTSPNLGGLPFLPYPSSIAAGDFNRDGKLDIVLEYSFGLIVLNGDGRGQLAASGSYFQRDSGATDFGSVVVADFNRDGKLDVAAVSGVGLDVSLGNGDGTFGPAREVWLSGSARSLVAADFNLDGKVDIAATDGSGVSVITGDGLGSFTVAPLLHTGTFPRYLAVADFNRDGLPDIIALDSGAIPPQSDSYYLALIAASPSGGFVAARDFPVGLNNSLSSVVTADFNGDGKLDLAAAGGGNVTLTPGDGAGGFGPATNFEVGNRPNFLLVADFNHDGRPDLAGTDNVSHTVSILLNNGAGGFASAASVSLGQFIGAQPHALAAGDFNGDGNTDLAVTDGAGFEGHVTILLGNGAGGFTASGVTLGHLPYAVAVADVNGDGRLDVLTLGSNRGNTPPYATSVAYLAGDGAGGFAAPSYLNLTLTNSNYYSGNFTLLASDFNGDGRTDLVIAYDGVNGSLGGVAVLDGDGRGGFGAPATYATGSQPRFITSADFNGDGKPDLAVTNWDGHSVSILTGRGTGGFDPAVNYAASNYPSSLASGDFNGDGRLDFAVANYGGTYAPANVTVTLNACPAAAAQPTIQFAAANFTVAEGADAASLTVTRAGDTSAAASVGFATVDDPAAIRCDDTVNNHGAAYARCDYATTVGTLSFAPGETQKTVSVPVIDDAFVEGVETFGVRLYNAQGAALGAPSTATVTIKDNDAAGEPNPILGTDFFVRQQYLDFLSRDPEPGQPWSAVLNNCAAGNTSCDRVTVSADFFLSQEFQLKGLFVFKFYKAAFGRMPLYSEITADMASVTGATTAELTAKKAAYTTAFAQRTEFRGLYDALTNQQFVDALMGRYNLQSITTINPASPDDAQAARVTLTRADLVAQLTAGTLTRAQVVRAVADSNEVNAAEFNPAFVAMQYFGYLRRDPETAGYNAWLNAINANPSDTRTMVNGFMNSTEYRLRFGQP